MSKHTFEEQAMFGTILFVIALASGFFGAFYTERLWVLWPSLAINCFIGWQFYKSKKLFPAAIFIILLMHLAMVAGVTYTIIESGY